MLNKLGFVALLLISATGYAKSGKELVEESGVKGGLVVHIDCNDGDFTSELRVNDKYIVQGLDTKQKDIEKARAAISAKGLSGSVSVDQFDGKHLPYVDNLVNLILDPGSLILDKEINRVLAPGGVLITKKSSIQYPASNIGNGFVKYTKPVPSDTDEWTHYLRDASGNAVAKDEKVGPPRRMQWKAGPLHTRDHDALASISAVTTSEGRIFYIIDEGHTSLMHRPPKWRLVARDAYNGILLWKRDIPEWVTHLANFRAGPAQITRRLVSIDDKVYVTLGLNAPVMTLDAATGKTLQTFKGSDKAEELIVQDNTLLTVIGDPGILADAVSDVEGFWQIEAKNVKPVKRQVAAYDTKTGKEKWRIDDDQSAGYIGLSLTASKNKAFYLNGEELQCRDINSGKKLWASAFPFKGEYLLNYTPTIVVYKDVILCLTYKELRAFSTADGKKLWETKGAVGFGAAGDLFVINDMVWAIPMTRFGAKTVWTKNDFLGNGGKEFWGMDLYTGEVKKSVPRNILPGVHHHRCYRNKATTEYLVYAQGGTEFLDLDGEEHSGNMWVRGICQYGVMPANGYLYVPPDPCSCYTESKVNGFVALAQDSSIDKLKENPPTLVKGPAYSKAKSIKANKKPASIPLTSKYWQPPIYQSEKADWPMFRANVTRSASTTAKLGESLEKSWQTKLGGNLTSTTAAGGCVYVSSKEEQTLYCLDAQKGKVKWTFETPCPVDSPPTIINGLCVFGCLDGSVYCLDASNGELAWQFKVAGQEFRIINDDRLESVWRVHGSVLVYNNTAYFVAGRSSHLDGGIKVFGLDLASGKTKYSAIVGEGDGAIDDILVTDGTHITMRNIHFDMELNRVELTNLKTIVAGSQFLDDEWFNRQNWGLGFLKANTIVDRITFKTDIYNKERFLGKLITFDASNGYGIQNPYSYLKRTAKVPTHTGHFHQKYSRYKPEWFPVGSRMMALENKDLPPAKPANANAKKKSGKGFPGYAAGNVWAKEDMFQPRFLALAGERLFAAGWKDAFGIVPKTGMPLNPDDPDPRDSVLRVISTADGSTINEYPLESEPVYDSVSIANGNLFMSFKDGTVACYKGGK